jgi:signal transduction histidine kinase
MVWQEGLSMDFTDSRIKINALHKNSRQIRLWAVFYLVGITLVISLIFLDSHRRFNRQLDRQLLLGAQAVPGVLPPNFHDRAILPGAISREEFLAQAQRLSDLATANEFHRLFTVIRHNGQLFLTAYNFDPKSSNIPSDQYFQPYPDAPPELIRVFDQQSPVYAHYSDQWGAARAVFIPARSPKGNVYVVGANYDSLMLHKNLFARLLVSLGIGLLAGLAAFPILLNQHITYRNHTQVLQEWTQALTSEVARRTEDLSREIADRKVFENRQAFTIRILERIQQPGPDPLLIQDILSLFKDFTGMEEIGMRLRKGSEFPFYRLPPPNPTVTHSEIRLPLQSVNTSCPLYANGEFPLSCLCGMVIGGRTDPSHPFFTSSGSFFSGHFPETYAQLRQAPPTTELRTDCLTHQIQTLTLIPISDGSSVIGLLHLSDSRPDRMSLNDIHFLENVAITFGMALHREQLVADLKDNHQQLQKALSDLRKAQKIIIQQERLAALGQLVSGISHDFNNALMPIRGLTQFILDNSDLSENPTEIRRLISIIAVASRDATAIVQRLKETFTPPPELQLQKIETEFLLDDILATARLRWEQATPPIPIKTELAIHGLDEFWADEIQIRGALLNLIYNAADTMPQGGTLTLTAGIEGDRAVLSVHDTGNGMTPEIRKKCLEPFFTTKGQFGTGIGLTMVQQAVIRHSGEIEIQTAPGQGTTVRILLPLNPPLPLTENSESETSALPVRPLKILVIDDDPIANEIIRHFLVRDGHEVTCLTQGREITDRFSETTFDLVITDRIMPSFSGEEVVRWVKTYYPTCPVILISGLPVLSPMVPDTIAGADYCLEKPITSKQLRSTIAGIFNRQSEPKPSSPD